MKEIDWNVYYKMYSNLQNSSENVEQFVLQLRAKTNINLSSFHSYII